MENAADTAPPAGGGTVEGSAQVVFPVTRVSWHQVMLELQRCFVALNLVETQTGLKKKNQTSLGEFRD